MPPPHPLPGEPRCRPQTSESLLPLSLLPQQFQSFSQYRCKTAKKSEEEIDFLRSNPKIWNVHSVLNVLHSLVDKSNINRQLEVYTSGGECCLPSVPGEERPRECGGVTVASVVGCSSLALGVNSSQVLMLRAVGLGRLSAGAHEVCFADACAVSSGPLCR